MTSEAKLQIELGCGQNKRPGFIGIDNQPFPVSTSCWT